MCFPMHPLQSSDRAGRAAAAMGPGEDAALLPDSEGGPHPLRLLPNDLCVMADGVDVPLLHRRHRPANPPENDPNRLPAALGNP